MTTILGVSRLTLKQAVRLALSNGHNPCTINNLRHMAFWGNRFALQELRRLARYTPEALS